MNSIIYVRLNILVLSLILNKAISQSKINKMEENATFDK